MAAITRAQGNRARNGRTPGAIVTSDGHVEFKKGKAEILRPDVLAMTNKAPNNDRRWHMTPNRTNRKKNKTKADEKYKGLRAIPDVEIISSKINPLSSSSSSLMNQVKLEPLVDQQQLMDFPQEMNLQSDEGVGQQYDLPPWMSYHPCRPSGQNKKIKKCFINYYYYLSSGSITSLGLDGSSSSGGGSLNVGSFLLNLLPLETLETLDDDDGGGGVVSLMIVVVTVGDDDDITVGEETVGVVVVEGTETLYDGNGLVSSRNQSSD